MDQAQNTLINFLSPMHTTEHYSAGFTYGFSKWEVSGYAVKAPRVEVKGANSIPLALGGGEANNSNHFYGFGLSLGRRFGRGS
jgi:long-chain fatty acid transport protein